MSLLLLIPMILIMTISGTFGALLFKQAMAKVEGRCIIHLIKAPRLYLGGMCYLLGAMLNIMLLQHMPYSIVYPMTSLTYIWTMVVSFFVLKEKISRNKIIAVVLIVTGVIVLNL